MKTDEEYLALISEFSATTYGISEILEHVLKHPETPKSVVELIHKEVKALNQIMFDKLEITKTKLDNGLESWELK